MYEARSEPHEFFGASREEAVAKACSFFSLKEGELQVRELSAPGVSGLGSRSLVVAWPEGRSPQGSRGDSSSSEDDRPRRGGREGGRDRDRGDRGERGGRDRGGRGGRDRDRGDRGDRGDRAARGPRESRREPAAAAAPALAPVENAGPSKGAAKGSLGEIGEFILGTIERMEIGPFEISENEEERFLVYSLSGAAAEHLAAGDGRGQEALQLLANQVASRQDADAKRVVIDAEGDSERRESLLERVASRAAKRATDTGRSVALDAMNGRDRRAIHLALRDEEGVATMSIGEGRYRQVLVVPEGASEYQEALDSCRQAGEDD